jgi:hypothetical protein
MAGLPSYLTPDIDYVRSLNHSSQKTDNYLPFIISTTSVVGRRIDLPMCRKYHWMKNKISRCFERSFRIHLEKIISDGPDEVWLEDPMILAHLLQLLACLHLFCSLTYLCQLFLAFRVNFL